MGNEFGESYTPPEYSQSGLPFILLDSIAIPSLDKSLYKNFQFYKLEIEDREIVTVTADFVNDSYETQYLYSFTMPKDKLQAMYREGKLESLREIKPGSSKEYIEVREATVEYDEQGRVMAIASVVKEQEVARDEENVLEREIWKYTTTFFYEPDGTYAVFVEGIDDNYSVSGTYTSESFPDVFVSVFTQPDLLKTPYSYLNSIFSEAVSVEKSRSERGELEQDLLDTYVLVQFEETELGVEIDPKTQKATIVDVPYTTIEDDWSIASPENTLESRSLPHIVAATNYSIELTHLSMNPPELVAEVIERLADDVNLQTLEVHTLSNSDNISELFLSEDKKTHFEASYSYDEQGRLMFCSIQDRDLYKTSERLQTEIESVPDKREYHLIYEGDAVHVIEAELYEGFDEIEQKTCNVLPVGHRVYTTTEGWFMYLERGMLTLDFPQTPQSQRELEEKIIPEHGTYWWYMAGDAWGITNTGDEIRIEKL